LEHKRKSKKATGKILNAAAGPSNEVHRHDVRTQKKRRKHLESIMEKQINQKQVFL